MDDFKFLLKDFSSENEKREIYEIIKSFSYDTIDKMERVKLHHGDEFDLLLGMIRESHSEEELVEKMESKWCFWEWLSADEVDDFYRN